MGCLGTDALLLYLRQGLTLTEREAAEEHLDACASCRRLVAELAATSLLRSASGSTTSPWLNDYLERGAEIGRYVVEDRVGQGAMGVVYRARDPELRRAVAIKLVRSAGADDERHQQRLLHEARALAQLSEPNVIPVYDAGIHDQRVFIVMEYVEGESLRRLLARERPGVGRVLELFAAAGRGLAAAHAAGIIHRDFKPDNVLVADRGRVLVADFGLAAHPAPTRGDTGEASPDDPERSRVLVGTPAYMAPEQVAGEPATTASDQFSFCVALFEALSGQRPFAAHKPGEVGGARHGPRALLRAVPSRLRPVLARGLAADPARRHRSMSALLAELERRPSGPRLALGMVLLGVAGIAGVVHARGGEPCEPSATEVWSPAQHDAVAAAFARADVGYDAFASIDRRLRARARTWADAASLRCSPRPEVQACFDRQRAGVTAVIDVLANADATVVEHAFELVSDLPDPRDCEASPGVAPDPRLAAALARVAAEIDAGRLPAAEALAQQALDRARAIGDEASEARALFDRGAVVAETTDLVRGIDDVTAAYELAVSSEAPGVAADASIHLVYLHGREAGSAREGLEWARHARAALDRLGGDPAREAKLHGNVATVRAAQGDYEAARAGYERARELWVGARGPEHPYVALLSTNLGAALNRLARHDEAVAEYERALEIHDHTVGSLHPQYGRVLQNMGNLYVRRNDFAKAEPLLRRALGVHEQTAGADSPNAAKACSNLANVLLNTGQLDEAEALYGRARKIYAEAHAPENPALGSVLVGMSGIKQARGEFDAAAELLREAAALNERALGPDHPELGLIDYNLCSILSSTEDLAGAQGHCRRALEIWEKALGPKHPHVALAHEDLANVLVHAGAPAEALEHAARAIEIRNDETTSGRAFSVRGLALMSLGQDEQAEASLRAAAQHLGELEGAPARGALARILYDRPGRREEAIGLAREARDTLAAAGPRMRTLVAEIDEWLAGVGRGGRGA